MGILILSYRTMLQLPCSTRRSSRWSPTNHHPSGAATGTGGGGPASSAPALRGASAFFGTAPGVSNSAWKMIHETQVDKRIMVYLDYLDDFLNNTNNIISLHVPLHMVFYPIVLVCFGTFTILGWYLEGVGRSIRWSIISEKPTWELTHVVH